MNIKYLPLLNQWMVWYGFEVWFFETEIEARNKLNEVTK